MSAPRRLLPSIAALRALEALDRLGSATAAAEELALTQGAVSRQLQALEAQLGTRMILREKRRMSLTPAARDYAAEVRAALGRIGRAGMRLQVSPGGGTLSLAILPTFGMRWLVPRLADFTRRHPEITLNLSTRIGQFNFASEAFDAALHYGAPDWPDADHLLLQSETLVPVCTPELRARLRLGGPGDLARAPLLHIESRPRAWQEWMVAQGVAAGELPGTLYDQFATITQAALHGLGVALLPHYLAEEDLATGRLVSAWGVPVAASGAYYLAWPRARAGEAGLRAFRDWLAGQAEGEDTLPR